jgi:hypothetical protein
MPLKNSLLPLDWGVREMRLLYLNQISSAEYGSSPGLYGGLKILLLLEAANYNLFRTFRIILLLPPLSS